MTSDRDPPLTWRQSLFYASIVPVAMLGVVVFFALGTGLIPLHVCTTEGKDKISSRGGFDFAISETDCDLPAKTAAMSVLVSRTGYRRRTPA
jgi:hypothetical protein